MKEAVVIKGSRSALLVKLSNEIPFAELVEKVAEKFHKTADFFGNGKILLGFTGRELSGEEEDILLETISANCSLQIPYLLDPDQEKEKFYSEYLELKQYKEEAERQKTEMRKAQEEKQKEKPKAAPDPEPHPVSMKQDFSGLHDIFYKGTLRSGAELVFEHSIVVLGDVKKGAHIASSGNIIILGSLKGTAHAGMYGDQNAFVVALNMDPVQIRIAEAIARAPDQSGEKEKKGFLFRKEKKNVPEKQTVYEPKIAFVEEGRIYMEAVGNDIYDDIHFLHT